MLLSVTERRRRSLHRRLPSGTPCPRVRLAYSLRQPRVVYHLPTPLILTIDRATSCRLLEYIRSAATTPRLVTSIFLYFCFAANCFSTVLVSFLLLVSLYRIKRYKKTVFFF